MAAAWRVVLMFALMALGSGCALLQPHLPNSVRVYRDVPYSYPNGRALALDVYEPATVTGPLPVIVWIHGGSWSGGSKARCPLAIIATNNLAIVSIDYRLTGVVPFPAQLHDCKAVIRWLRANAATYHFDPDHIAVFGASAGGHLAALVGTTGDLPELEGDGGSKGYSSRVQAVCVFYPPTDLDQVITGRAERTSSTSSVARFLGGPLEQHRDVAAQANPNRYINRDTPPFFILHGSADKLVPIRHSELLAEALRKNGVEVHFEVVQGRGHGIAAPRNVVPEIVEFLNRHLRPGQAGAKSLDKGR